jgi:hypothetical protein
LAGVTLVVVVVVTFAAGVLVVIVLVLVVASAGLAISPSTASEPIKAFIELPPDRRQISTGKRAR